MDPEHRRIARDDAPPEPNRGGTTVETIGLAPGRIGDSAPVGILLLDGEGRIMFVDPRIEAMFGYPREELLGKPVEVVVPVDLREMGWGCCEGDASDLESKRRDAGRAFIGRRRDGSDVPVEVSLSPVETKGECLIACVLQDTTVRRRVEEEQQDRFFRLSIDMLCIAGFDGYFKRLNPACQRTLGYTVEQLLAEPFMNFVHPEDRDATLVAVQHLMRGADVIAFENRYRCQDGTYKWLLWNSVPVTERQQIYAVAHDITERKQAEAELQRTADELSRSNGQLMLLADDLSEVALSEHQAHEVLRRTYEELKMAQVQLVQAEKLVGLGQMVAGVAHEINNPLAYVRSNVAVLRRDFGHLHDLLRLYQEAEGTLAEHQPDVLARIRGLDEQIDLAYTLGNLGQLIDRSGEGLKRIQQIVKDLRDFAQLDEGDLKEVDLNEGIRSTVNIISGRAKEQGIEVAMDLVPLPPVACSPGKVNQVVLNLLANAIDASHEGGLVTIRTRTVPDGVELHVLDTGQGIDPAIRGRIFDPFFTTKPVGQGTGLGLSISYGIVQAHGGSIAVESTSGRGTHFVVRLPSIPSSAGPSSN